MAGPDEVVESSATGPERRAWLRADCDLAAWVRAAAGNVLITGQALDISEGGLRLRVSGPLEPGTACRLAIDLPDGVSLSDFPASVIWCRPETDEEDAAHEAGLAFDDLSPGQRAALSMSVQRQALAMIRRVQAATAGLVRVSRFLDSFADLHALLERIMDEAKRLTDAEASSLLLWDVQQEELFFEVALGEKGGGVRRLRLQRGQGVAGAAALSGKPVNVPDVKEDERWFQEADAASGFETRSILAVPMLRQGRLIGVLEVLNRRGDGGFTEDDEANLSVLAGEAAIVIENARLHQEKVQAERLAAVGRTVAELAHGIKNILNGIQGGAYVLESGLTKDDPDKVRKGWEMVRRNNTFLSDLVLDMLAYARDREPRYEDTDVNHLIETVVGLLAERAGQRGIAVEAEVDAALTVVRVDPTGIYRVLLNLGTNAVEACAEGSGRVWLRSRRGEDGWFTLEVEDNGSGISPEDRRRLFKEFFSTKGAKGTGLGLAVCAKIVREHGGRIDVTSEVGTGTTFVIRLPAAGKRAADPIG